MNLCITHPYIKCVLSTAVETNFIILRSSKLTLILDTSSQDFRSVCFAGHGSYFANSRPNPYPNPVGSGSEFYLGTRIWL